MGIIVPPCCHFQSYFSLYEENKDFGKIAILSKEWEPNVDDGEQVFCVGENASDSDDEVFLTGQAKSKEVKIKKS